jgi:PST family polysaccharide transporter
MRIDQVMIKNLLGEHELGIYAAIIPISNLWNMLPVAICASFAPMMAKKRSEGIDIFNASLTRMFRIFWVLCLVIILATLLLSRVVIKLMYGDAYLDSIPVLNIYVFTCIPVFMGVGQSLWILNERKPYLYPMQTISGAIVSVLANLILLPLWGINGGAFAAVIAQITSCFLINSIFVRRLFLMQIGFIGRKIKA